MTFRSITSAYLGCYFLLAVILAGCTAPSYSPGLGLGVDQLPNRHTRLGVSLERVPNVLSAKEGWPRMYSALSFRYERGLSDDFTLRAKLLFAGAASENVAGNGGLGLGIGLGGVLRNQVGLRTDLLVVPRLQLIQGGLFGGGGIGGGMAMLLRQRLRYNLAIYGGPAAYFGSSPGMNISTNGGEALTPGGRALGGHFGLSFNANEKTNFNFEITPLSQHDNIHKRTVWVPVLQLAFAYRIVGYDLGERRMRRQNRRKNQIR